MNLLAPSYYKLPCHKLVREETNALTGDGNVRYEYVEPSFMVLDMSRVLSFRAVGSPATIVMNADTGELIDQRLMTAVFLDALGEFATFWITMPLVEFAKLFEAECASQGVPFNDVTI